MPDRGAQVISIAFQLLNLVEENAAQQAVRAREMALGEAHQSGLWRHYLNRLKAAGVPAADILKRIAGQPVEPVLTGHPTEAKRWTVLDQHRELYVLLVQLENRMYTDAERLRIREKIKAVLEHLWRTGEILMTKPDVRTERLNALYYFRERFPVILEQLDDRFRCAWEKTGYAAESPLKAADYPQLRFGSWVGGDRDGHPLVTAGVTRDTLRELRHNALAVLDERLARTQKRLGLSSFGQTVPLMLTDRIKQLRHLCGPAVEDRLDHQDEEPWRQMVSLIRARLPMPRNQDIRALYRTPGEALEDLQLLEASLQAVRAERIIAEDVLPVERLLDVFGFHLASLDIRQNSAFHDQAAAQLVEAAGMDSSPFVSGSEEDRLAFLEKELASLRPFTRPDTPLGKEARATVDTFLVVEAHLKRHGRAGLGCLIVSMTRSLSDLLAVYLICREAGLMVKTPKGPACLLPVVPLFETIDDLERSSDIMACFLQHPITRASLAISDHRLDEIVADPHSLETIQYDPDWEQRQVVMLGYSDSNKDSGILASQWSLQAAQQRLLAIGRDCGVRIQFFHGRGGTVSRGAGPTHRFLEALPEGSLLGGLRVTEQGETVAQKFTNFRTATYNLELLMAGTTGVSMLPLNRKPDSSLSRAMDFLTARSRRAYEAFLQDPDFITFYRQATPIDVLEMSRIGSRPARRTGRMSLEDLRAIPWVFSWTQARFYFPGWYGVGSALAELRQAEPDLHEAIASRFREWPFLRYVLFNIESGLASANARWMKAYAGLVEDAPVRERLSGCIAEEFALTRSELDAILGGSLEKRRPRFFKTLQDRESDLDILHGEQIRLLREWRSLTDNSERDRLLPDLLLTVNAIASGLRTTG
jgi:phosphoenolpyruvate carboxylase